MYLPLAERSGTAATQTGPFRCGRQRGSASDDQACWNRSALGVVLLFTYQGHAAALYRSGEAVLPGSSRSVPAHLRIEAGRESTLPEGQVEKLRQAAEKMHGE